MISKPMSVSLLNINVESKTFFKYFINGSLPE